MGAGSPFSLSPPPRRFPPRTAACLAFSATVKLAAVNSITLAAWSDAARFTAKRINANRRVAWSFMGMI
jgi:hypothetical protein